MYNLTYFKIFHVFRLVLCAKIYKLLHVRSEAVKRHVDGNIHRLTADDSDDESATWNGNSTQQM